MTPAESKINELLARIQVRSELIGQLRTMNDSDKTRIRLIEESEGRKAKGMYDDNKSHARV